MRKNIYFISDAHLAYKDTELEKKKQEKLDDFLQFVLDDRETKTLYLVGDIFDFWFQWYHVVPRYWFSFLYRFRQLIESGIEVVFITGNHDFYPGSYLEKEVGMKCFDESHEFELDSKRFFVAHGDGYAKNDWGYRILKRIIRSRLSIFLYKTFISPDMGMLIARMFSKSSREFGKIDKTAWAEEYYKYAQTKFREGYDYVLTGHLHYPLTREQDNHIYVSLGDWITYFTYAKYDGETLSLYSF